MTLRLEDDQYCFVCGKENTLGFGLTFKHTPGKFIRTEVVFDKKHQGYKGIVHGGFISMLLDEVMVNLAWKEKKPAVTAELTVRLKKAVRIGEKVIFEGRFDEVKGRLIRASAEARGEGGELLATATAQCMMIRPPAEK